MIPPFLIENSFWILFIIVIYWFLKRLRRIINEKKAINEFRERSKEYTFKLAKTLDDIGLVKKNILTLGEILKLKTSLESLPQIDIVQKTIKALDIYTSYLDKHPEMTSETEILRGKVMIPLMINFIYIFSIADDELYKLIDEAQDKYVKEGLKQNEFIPKLLDLAIEKAIERGQTLNTRNKS